MVIHKYIFTYLHTYINMAKGNNYSDRLKTMGDKLSKAPAKDTPLQEHKQGRVDPVEQEVQPKADVKFTVHIPEDLMDQVRTIGFTQKKTLKAIFGEALQDYVSKNS